MAHIDKVLKDLYNRLLEAPEVETRMFWKDGTPAKHRVLLNEKIVIPEYMGFALTTAKKMPLKGPMLEMDWIWRDRSVVVKELRDKGSKIWDEWELEDGTIGESYGWILDNLFHEVNPSSVSKKAIEAMRSSFEEGWEPEVSNGVMKLNQVQYVIHKLIDDPYDKGIITNLWQVSHLSKMSLRPCVFQTQWNVLNGKLHLTVYQRSADSFLGLPFNLAGYHALLHLMAESVGLKVGTYTHFIGNAHLYDRHYDAANEFIKAPEYHANFILDKNVKFDDYECGKNYEVIRSGTSPTIAAEVCVTKTELDRLNKKTSD